MTPSERDQEMAKRAWDFGLGHDENALAPVAEWLMNAAGLFATARAEGFAAGIEMAAGIIRSPECLRWAHYGQQMARDR
jgi:hypothetical protein